jgi:hypothetical protein
LNTRKILGDCTACYWCPDSGKSVFYIFKLIYNKSDILTSSKVTLRTSHSGCYVQSLLMTTEGTKMHFPGFSKGNSVLVRNCPLGICCYPIAACIPTNYGTVLLSTLRNNLPNANATAATTDLFGTAEKIWILLWPSWHRVQVLW